MGKWFNKYGWVIGPICSVAFLGIVITPQWVLTPNREVKPYVYYDAQKVFNKVERRSYGDSPGEEVVQTYTGACPDLAMMTSKALMDKKLTISEAHYLRKEAKRLYNEGKRNELRNDALVAAGQKPLPNTIDCPHGDTLFN